MAGSRKTRAARRPRALTRGVRADRILEELGGIAGRLQTCAGAWPEDLDLADFEAVLDLVVDRCRSELGSERKAA
jgi:hypothetical protein